MERRSFLVGGAAVTFAGLASDLWAPVFAAVAGPGPYGSLLAADANGVQLPAGFTSRIIGRTGQAVAGTTYQWHSAPDGGSCFPSSGGGWVYASNSEVSGGQGGVSAIKFGANGSVVDAYSILSGTNRNCSGGPTPWGTWLSCEESGPGGAVFECNPQVPGQGIRRPALGLFNHEAVAVDAATGDLYLTEDDPLGRLYRFVPATPGDLSSGSLYAASLSGTTVIWIPASPTGPDRQASTTAFNGGEGMYAGNGFIYFTTKNDRRVWRIDPPRSEVAVMHDCQSSSTDLDAVDNLTVHPQSGDVYIAEDGGNMELCVLGVVNGVHQAAAFMRLPGQSSSEVTGPSFSPDGSRLYVSSQRGTDGTNGITYEISGPFRSLAQGPGPRVSVLYCSADSYVRGGNYASANYGTESRMAISYSTSENYLRWTYLAVPLTVGTEEITSAVLQVRAQLALWDAAPVYIYGIADTSWTNTSISWANRPALGSIVGEFTATSSRFAWYEADVTSWVAERRAAGDQKVGFALCPQSGSRALTMVESSESSSAGSRLVITSPADGTPPPPNDKPVAAFTAMATDLTVTVDGTSSSDPDGSLTAWSWDFGDSTSAVGATATHTYSSAGTFTVTLTVTDNRGATASTSHDVEVSAPPPSPFKVLDDFERSVTSGWGAAVVGGSWSVVGNPNLYGVSNGLGTQTLDVAGRTVAARLDQVSETDIDATIEMAIDKALTGGGIYSYVQLRVNGNQGYRLRVRAETTKTSLTIYRRVNGVFSAIASTTISGFVLSPANSYQIRFSALGSAPTNLSAKMWETGSVEPTQPQVGVTDNTAVLQGPGAIGLETYMSGSVTNAPLTLRYYSIRA